MSSATFWDKMAARYAAKPVDDPESYDRTLDRVRTYLSTKDRMLELGCGTGTTALRLAPSVREIIATDYSAGMIDQAKARKGSPNVTFRTAAIGEVTGPFDVVTAFNLLHLLPDLPGDLTRIAGLIRPGGLFISKSGCLGWKGLWLSVPIGLMRLLGKAPYVRILSADQLSAMITAAGFEILESIAIPEGSHNQFIVARRR